MKKALVAICAAAFLAALGLAPAMGQNVVDEGNAQADLITISCGSLNALDAQLSAATVYYIAGYSDGQSTALAATGPADTEAGSAEGGGIEDASGVNAEQGADGAAPSEGVTASGDQNGDASGLGGTTTDMSSGGANESIAGLGISVDQILAACAEAPDSPASEVIKVARGASQPEIDPQDEDPAAEGEEGQDVGSGNAVVE